MKSRNNKIKLYAIGNRGEYNHFIFKKEQRLLSFLEEILSKIGGDRIFTEDMVYEGGSCGIREVIEEGKKPKQKNINTIIDERYNFYDKGYNIDIIFANRRVFVIANLTKHNKEMILKFLRENCKF